MKFVLVICLSYGVILSFCEVVLVTRNVTDAFRVGDDGCVSNASVCTSRSATCQPRSGLCLCSGNPDFRNPVIEKVNEKLAYGNTFGCVRNDFIRFGVGNAACPFKPFQVIPYSHDDSATEFSHDSRNVSVLSCVLIHAWTKFPDNLTEVGLPWLNESYVDLSISDNTMHFEWERDVPELQGTIITLNLSCKDNSSSFTRKCLRAKVLGTWPRASTNLVSTVTGPATEVIASSTSTMVVDPTTFIEKSSTLLAGSSITPETTVSSDESSDSSVSIKDKVFYGLCAALAVFLVVISVLGCVVRSLWKKPKRNEDKNVKTREMQNIDGQQTTNAVPVGEVLQYVNVLKDSGVDNVGGDYNSSVPAEEDNNRALSGHLYEEPLNYEPLKMDHSQGENDKYQSLIKQNRNSTAI